MGLKAPVIDAQAKEEVGSGAAAAAFHTTTIYGPDNGHAHGQ